MDGEDSNNGRQNESIISAAIRSDSYSKQDNISERVNYSYDYDSNSKTFLNLLNATRQDIAEDNRAQSKNDEKNCHLNKESEFRKLKYSTIKLLILLEEILSKTRTKNNVSDGQRLTEFIRPISKSTSPPTASEIIGEIALEQFESQAKTLEAIHIEDDNCDDCSVYKRLTRKCICLNSHEYNDFVIHFNEDTDYYTNNMGEIIKNVRILKKFLYMGGNYTKRVLMFLNEGLSESSHTEKADIIQGCSYADICNIFDQHSIVTSCISWPDKYNYYGDSVTQGLTSDFLYKLTQLEEGRRYLNFTSKITADIKKVLRKKSTYLETNSLNRLKATINLMNPPYYSKNEKYNRLNTKLRKNIEEYQSPYKYGKSDQKIDRVDLPNICRRPYITPTYTD